MNAFPLAFCFVTAFALAVMPRRWAPLPLLIGSCYMTLGSGVEVGPFNFPIIRILVAVGIVRVILRRERLAGGANSLDGLMIAWTGWALLSGLFHHDVTGTLVHRLGLTYNACGVYFLVRIFCQTLDDLTTILGITAILLVPLSIAMLSEAMTGRNLFAALGGVQALSEVRDGRIRAQGPFAHSILAGTVGAASLPVMCGLWLRSWKTALAGVIACSVMVFTSGSSGPILSAVAGIAGLFLWRWRNQMHVVRWVALLSLISLEIVMKAPAYYLLARIDLTGSSASWYRAYLIETAFAHLSEWWLVGTDLTRHWMHNAVGWSADHIDVTNYYVNMGVWGGLPLLGLFVATLVRAFYLVGAGVRHGAELSMSSRFVIWTLAASLFSHAVTFMSVSYFDQTVVFLYATLAAIGSLRALTELEGGTSRLGAGMTYPSPGLLPYGVQRHVHPGRCR
jgi:hypothetical protein